MFGGYADLRLCSGPVPHYREIVELAGALAEYIIDEFGTSRFLMNLADPLWFQCFACLCGFEWQFSGSTTVTLMALKEAVHGNGLYVFGGKGRNMAETSDEFCREYELTLKVDERAVQDGYGIYFHALIHDGRNWVVIDQGMDERRKYARRYHWFSSEDLILGPDSVAGGQSGKTLDLTSKENSELRKTIMDVLSDEPSRRIRERILTLSIPPEQKTLFEEERIVLPYHLRIPKSVSLEAIELARRAQTFEELVRVAGKSIIRGLAFVSHLVYSAPLSWKDPVRYTFAFGTKAGKPFPVEREKMRSVASFLKCAVEESRAGSTSKKRALRRLNSFIKPLFL